MAGNNRMNTAANVALASEIVKSRVNPELAQVTTGTSQTITSVLSTEGITDESILASKVGEWLVMFSEAQNLEAVQEAIATGKVFTGVMRSDNRSVIWTIKVGNSVVSFNSVSMKFWTIEAGTTVKFTLVKGRQPRGTNDYVIMAVIQEVVSE